MSGWHRDNPELVGTDADPWMIHDSYRKAVRPYVEPDDYPSIEEQEWELEQDAKRAAAARAFDLGFAGYEDQQRIEHDPVCSACFGSGVERSDHGLGERCSLCKGRGV